jgi:hypothetical protein
MSIFNTDVTHILAQGTGLIASTTIYDIQQSAKYYHVCQHCASITTASNGGNDRDSSADDDLKEIRPIGVFSDAPKWTYV